VLATRETSDSRILRIVLTHAERVLSAVSPAPVTAHEQRSTMGRRRRSKFREVALNAENPTTELLAEGLTALTEALRELDDTAGMDFVGGDHRVNFLATTDGGVYDNMADQWPIGLSDRIAGCAASRTSCRDQIAGPCSTSSPNRQLFARRETP
jgi:hypothetical protein